MSQLEDSQAHGEAVARAELGLPIPRGSRLRFFKRGFARLSWYLLRHQIAYNTAVTAELAELRQALVRHEQALFLDQETALREQQTALHEQEATLQEQAAALNEHEAALREQAETVRNLETALRVQINLVQRQAFTWHHEGLGDLRSEIVETAYQIAELHKKIDSEVLQIRTDAEARAVEARGRQGAIDLLLSELRRTLPEPPSVEQLSRLPDAMDSMYTVFADVFRGPSRIVKQYAKEYLPDILALPCRGPVVDLGSGRGEWLEVLREADVEAYGVDLHTPFAEECRGRGLTVVLGDARDHLASVPERSLSAVTAFHLAEHLSFDCLIEIMDLALRALGSGGLLILETPNPENLVVGASSFYIDPTHQRPLPPSLLAFLVEARGFGEVETRFLHPSEVALRGPSQMDAWSSDVAPLVNVMNERLFGPRDYAVIGRRQ